MTCNDCHIWKRYKAKVPTATECPAKGKAMACGKCGAVKCEQEILVNYGVCDECIEMLG